MAVYEVETEQGVFEVEIEDQKLPISVDRRKGFGEELREIPQQLTTQNVAIGVGNIPRPPVLPSELNQQAALSIASPLQSKIGLGLETAGKRVKEAASESVGNIMKSRYPKTEAAIRFGIESAPFTPSEFAVAAGGEMLPSLAIPIAKKYEKVSSAIATKYLGTDIKLLQKELRTGQEKLSEKFLKNKTLTGSREEVANQADEIVNQFEDAIQNKLKTVSKEESSARFITIKKQDIAKGFDNAIDDLKKTGFDEPDIRKIQKLKKEFLSRHGEDTTVDYWMNVKRKIYKDIGNKNYLKDNPASKIEAQMSVASKIKEMTEKVIPELKELNKKQGFYLQVRNSLNNVLAKQEKDIVGSIMGGEKEGVLLKTARAKYAVSRIPEARGGIGLGIPVNREMQLNETR